MRAAQASSPASSSLVEHTATGTAACYFTGIRGIFLVVTLVAGKSMAPV